MRAPRQGQVEVELVEVDGWVPASGDDDPRPDWRDLLRRVPPRVWAVVAGAVALAVAVTGTAGWLADRAESDRLARTDGLTVPLAAPLQEVWRTTRDEPVGVVGDVLVMTGMSGALGVALSDGSTRWQHVTQGSSWCWFVRDEDLDLDSAWSGGLEEVDPASALLACADLPFGYRPGSRTVVTVLDPSTGEVARQVEIPGEHPVPVADGVATLTVDAERRVVGGRWSLRTGETVWEHVGEPVEELGVDVWPWGDGAALVLELPQVTVRVDLATGEPAGPAADARGTSRDVQRVELPDGGTATTRVVDEERLELVVADADGEQRFTTAGHVVDTRVHDGTAPGTLLIVSSGRDGMMAVDARTGDELWRTELDPWNVMVLSGRVVVRTEERLAALDARTGETVWAHDDRSSLEGSLVTDGRVLLTLGREDGETFLVARDAQTGEETWRLPSPVTQATLKGLPDGRVLLSGPGEAVLLAP